MQQDSLGPFCIYLAITSNMCSKWLNLAFGEVWCITVPAHSSQSARALQKYPGLADVLCNLSFASLEVTDKRRVLIFHPDELPERKEAVSERSPWHLVGRAEESATSILVMECRGTGEPKKNHIQSRQKKPCRSGAGLLRTRLLWNNLSFSQHYFLVFAERRWFHQLAFGLWAMGKSQGTKTAEMGSA